MQKIRIITDAKGNKEAVILPWKEYEKFLKLKKENSSLKETLYLLKSEKNRTRLLEALKDIEKGLVEEHDLIED
jgi:PHD/YefM family antitoxin component YafN of YafNO toxin-antitoxin module